MAEPVQRAACFHHFREKARVFYRATEAAAVFDFLVARSDEIIKGATETPEARLGSTSAKAVTELISYFARFTQCMLLRLAAVRVLTAVAPPLMGAVADVIMRRPREGRTIGKDLEVAQGLTQLEAAIVSTGKVALEHLRSKGVSALCQSWAECNLASIMGLRPALTLFNLRTFAPFCAMLQVIDEEAAAYVARLNRLFSVPVKSLLSAASKARSLLDNGRILAEIAVLCDALVRQCDADQFLAEHVYRTLLPRRIEKAARKEAEDAAAAMRDSLLTLEAEAEGKGTDTPSAKVSDR